MCTMCGSAALREGTTGTWCVCAIALAVMTSVSAMEPLEVDVHQIRGGCIVPVFPPAWGWECQTANWSCWDVEEECARVSRSKTEDNNHNTILDWAIRAGAGCWPTGGDCITSYQTRYATHTFDRFFGTCEASDLMHSCTIGIVACADADVYTDPDCTEFEGALVVLTCGCTPTEGSGPEAALAALKPSQ